MERKLAKEIHMASNKICRKLDIITSKYAFTRAQHAVFHYLTANKHRDVFQKDIEEEFGIRRSSVSAILSHMEEKGYITRSSVDRDARLKKITPTKKGEEMLAQSQRIIADYEKKLMDGIPEEEIDIFFKVLGELSDKADSTDM